MTDDSPDGDADRPRGLVRRKAASFRPYWIRVPGVTLLIIVTAGLGVVNPLLIRGGVRLGPVPAVRRPRPALAVDSGRGDGRGHCGHRRSWHPPDLHDQPGGAARNAEPARPALHPPPEPVTGVFHGHSHRRNPVPHSQRRGRGSERRNQHRVQRSVEHGHRHKHAGCHDHTLVAAYPGGRGHSPRLLPAHQR